MIINKGYEGIMDATVIESARAQMEKILKTLREEMLQR